jgi:hypothetical protein
MPPSVEQVKERVIKRLQERGEVQKSDISVMMHGKRALEELLAEGRVTYRVGTAKGKRNPPTFWRLATPNPVAPVDSEFKPPTFLEFDFSAMKAEFWKTERQIMRIWDRVEKLAAALGIKRIHHETYEHIDRVLDAAITEVRKSPDAIQEVEALKKIVDDELRRLQLARQK